MRPWILWIVLVVFVILAGVFLAGVSQTSADRALSSLPEFGRYVVELLRERYPDRSFALTEDGTGVETGTNRLGLVNLYRELRSSGAQGKEIDSRIIEFYESSLAGLSKIQDGGVRWIEARRILRPQLVPAGFGQRDLDAVSRELLPGLQVAYVLDAEDHYIYVSRRDLEAWRIDAKQLDQTALANLAASQSLEIEVKRPKDPAASGKYLFISVEDGYAATRILLPDVRRRVASLLGERFFVAVPNRDLLVAWSLDLTNHEGFVEQTKEEYEQRSHPISPEIYMASVDELRPATRAELERRF